MTNAEKINEWRELNPASVLTADVLMEILGVDSLRGADLRGADLRGADLRGADLRGADLRGADLRGANLRGANLRGANLRDAQGGVLTVSGLPSGDALLTPTPNGWSLRVGCWTGKVVDLEALIATDEGWPEAVGAECARRRPTLEALITLCHAHMNTHPHLIDDLRATWAHQDTTTKKEKTND